MTGIKRILIKVVDGEITIDRERLILERGADEDGYAITEAVPFTGADRMLLAAVTAWGKLQIEDTDEHYSNGNTLARGAGDPDCSS